MPTQAMVDECRRQGVAVRVLPRAELDELAGNNAHQGVVAVTSAKQYNDLEDVVAAKRGQYSLIVVLDGSRLVEVGTHEELMANRGQYSELYAIQAAAYR